jgi:hypothetical protein
VTDNTNIRLAVIDDDKAFVTVLSKRLADAGWQHRVLPAAVRAAD